MVAGPVQLSDEDRARLGKEARARAPRTSQAEFTPLPDRPDPVSLLESQAASRDPGLVPIRYGRMLSSPFAFFRGAALIMAGDLAATARSGFNVQLCGDAHLSNFGVFGTPERRLVFDLNDFDETLPGPWEWDVKRLATSLEVAGRDREFSDPERRAIVAAAGETYRRTMREFAAMRTIDVWYSHVDVDRDMALFGADLAPVSRRRTLELLDKARTRDSMHALTELTADVDGQRRFVSDPPLIVPIEELLPQADAESVSDAAHRLLEEYRRSLPVDRRHLLDQYRFAHVARKVVGVGSVGTRSWVILLLGRDSGDPLILQAKEAQASVLGRFLERSPFDNEGARVVAGQQIMQASSDIFLGWVRGHLQGVQPRDFYFRQLRDWKGSADVDRMIPSGMKAYARVCAWTLARAHARSGDRIAIAAYLGRGQVFDEALVVFAQQYADQSQRDYDALRLAVKNGTVVAHTGI
jgi:uncharacterized protein (DUF2252 family)